MVGRETGLREAAGFRLEPSLRGCGSIAATGNICLNYDLQKTQTHYLLVLQPSSGGSKNVIPVPQ